MINNNFVVIDRVGYGSNFNKISIDKKNNIIKKECINEYGQKKINHELNFYKFLIRNNISFKIPIIYSQFKNGYVMEYLNDYEPLYKLFYKLDKTKQIELISRIKGNLDLLHNSYKKTVSKEEYISNLKLEIETKIRDRYNIIKDKVNNYSYIKTVNNIEIMSFENTLLKNITDIYNLIELKDNTEFYFVPIHGDCQFNNILYNIEKDDFIFIDPRGYYGNSDIYGIPEYDFAKLLFALTGYDEFDNREIDKLDVNNNNINVHINIWDETLLINNKLDVLLMRNIWLGNSQIFMENNEYKGIYSYFLALYICNYFTNLIVN